MSRYSHILPFFASLEKDSVSPSNFHLLPIANSTSTLYILSQEDGTIQLWEVASGQCLRTFQGHTNTVTSVCLSADGSFALSGSNDQALRLWELEAHDPVDWDKEALPYLEIFLNQHTPYAVHCQVHEETKVHYQGEQLRMPGKLTLTITAGPKAGEKPFVFEEHDTLLFGRMADCQVCLPEDKYLSRHHFILEVNPPDARVRDLGSLHGTYINGRKYGGREKGETPEEGAKREYPQVDLHDGDEIKVGKTVFRVRVESAGLVGMVRCQRCGKDVSVEVGAGRQGDYMCQACRQEIEADSDALLKNLLDQAQSQRQVGVNIPDYQIVRELGKGGMGLVYLARHKKDSRQVALKVMLSKVAVDDVARLRFLREMEATRTLRHQHIVEFLEGGAQGSVFYFLLEFCEGGDVADLMERRGGRLTLDEAGPIMLQALEGLAYVHEKGFVHRDLKPQNILLKGGEGHWSVKVSDLGLAKSFEQAGFSGMTVTGDVAGTPPFMPREQVINFKRFKPVSDVWAMGATCYNMLTGSYPRNFRREVDPLEVILNGEIVPIRQRDARIPARVAEVIDRSLVNDVNRRYQNAGEMYEALARTLK